MAKKSSEELSVVVFWTPSAKQQGFKGPAVSVSTENKLGRLDILPQHTNFISLIFNNLTIQKPDKQKVEYQFKRGVLEVSDDTVKVFLGI